MKNILKYGVMACFAAVALTSCDDWTDPKPVGVEFETVKDKDPEAYAKYLENLRAYRNNGHKKFYAWYANQASFASQAHHVSAVPDSIDVLVLHNPVLVGGKVKAEMNQKRSDTGMKMAYTVDYAAIRASWTTKKELATPEKPAPEWSAFLADSLNVALGYADILGFDRIVVAYDGKQTGGMTAAERADYEADQQAFLNPVKSWIGSHQDKGFDFLGAPVNLTDPSFLSGAGVIFLSESASATNTTEYEFLISRNTIDGVTDGKFAMMASLPVLDANQASVGYWGTRYSSWLMAAWCNGAVVTNAAGVTNLADDYYDPHFSYKVCRGAIQRLNPAAK